MSRMKAAENPPSGHAAAGPDRKQEPPVPIRQSVTRECIVCLECGRKQKMLKRHLSAAHGMTPDEYRTKWGLPSTYPMIARGCAERRGWRGKKVILRGGSPA